MSPFEVEAEPPLIEIRRDEIQMPNVQMARLIFGWLGQGLSNLMMRWVWISCQ